MLGTGQIPKFFLSSRKSTFFSKFVNFSKNILTLIQKAFTTKFSSLLPKFLTTFFSHLPFLQNWVIGCPLRAGCPGPSYHPHPPLCTPLVGQPSTMKTFGHEEIVNLMEHDERLYELQFGLARLCGFILFKSKLSLLERLSVGRRC